MEGKFARKNRNKLNYCTYLCKAETDRKLMEETFAKYINVKGELLDLSQPQVMGILNVTPDSFYANSRKQTEKDILCRVHQILDEGGTFIDMGAYSSRQGAADVSPEEEMQRLRQGLAIIQRECPEALVSIDTFRADVAKMCVEEYGAALINDISAGDLDPEMFPTLARLKVPYILMHMQGNPQNMQHAPHYDNPVKEIIRYFAEKIEKLRVLGVKDLIIDPGFGFGKTLQHNYEILHKLEEFQIFQLPVLVGVSRKSMVYKLVGGSPEDALNGTTALHAIALMKGAQILRVHDVKAAVETVRIFNALNEPQY